MKTDKTKTGIEYITSLWSSVIEIKDAAFINIKARKLRKDGRNTITSLIKEIENDNDLFQDNFEKMPLIQLIILLNVSTI